MNEFERREILIERMKDLIKTQDEIILNLQLQINHLREANNLRKQIEAEQARVIQIQDDALKTVKDLEEKLAQYPRDVRIMIHTIEGYKELKKSDVYLEHFEADKNNKEHQYVVILVD